MCPANCVWLSAGLIKQTKQKVTFKAQQTYWIALDTSNDMCPLAAFKLSQRGSVADFLPLALLLLCPCIVTENTVIKYICKGNSKDASLINEEHLMT